MRLVIAEKPKLARCLKQGLGEREFETKDGYFESKSLGLIITNARGHLLSLYEIEDYEGEKLKWAVENLPYIPKQFKYKPTPSPDHFEEKQFKLIKSLINRADVDEIIHYGDPDREGEVLIRLILMYAGNKKPVKRLWCNSIVPEVIRDAYKQLYNDSDYDNWFEEGVTRQHVDWLWGINLSRFVTVMTGEKMPAGRVLVPIVKYVYDRDMAIKNFTVSYKWGVEGLFKHEGKDFKLRNDKLVYEESEKALADAMAVKLNGVPCIVTDIKKKMISKKPNLMFSLSKLQMELSKQYNIGVEESMKVIQGLYEEGYLTYPRTNTEYISEKEIENTRRIVNLLISKGLPLTFATPKTIFDESKCGGHTAITITPKLPDVDKLTDVQKKVYMTVYNRFVSNFCAKPEIEETTVVFKSVISQNEEYEFLLKGERVISEGFLKYEKRNLSATLPEFTKGDSLRTVPPLFEVVKKESSPPKKVTVAALLDYLSHPYKDKIKNMDSDDELYELLSKGCTLGTEATMTSIISNAIKYDYISEKNKSYSITDKGIRFITALDKLNINLYRDKNVEINQALKAIYNKQTTRAAVVTKVSDELRDTIEKGKTVAIEKANPFSAEQKGLGTCLKCGGKIIETKVGYSCENVLKKDDNGERKCNVSLYFDNKYLNSLGLKVNKTIAKALLTKGSYNAKLTSKKTGKPYEAVICATYDDKYPRYEMKFAEKK